MACNIAQRLRGMARELPNKRAVVFPESRDRYGRVAYTHLTFEQLDRESDHYARGFERAGITRGTKTLLMVRPSLDFFALTFALFKVGAPPILIDPGMGRERLMHCIQSAAPDAMVGIPLAHLARRLWPKYFKSVKVNVTVGRRWLWDGYTLRDLRDEWHEPFKIADTAEDELAAILFTTGSTGPAKGVEYEHGMFMAQCDLLQSVFNMGPDDIDLPTFPLFALFSVGLGMTAVIPDMDPTKPAQVNPERIVEAIRNQGCTFTFGSPMLWNRVTKYCVDNRIKFPTLRRVLLAGAPVPQYIHERFGEILPEGATTNTPYGATESLPVANITGAEVLAETAELTRKGKGICVGKPIPSMKVEIIKLSDENIPEWSDSLVVPQGSVGEITVKGPTVTKRYYQNEKATAQHKIKDGDVVRHRIGDLGYFDDKGRLWFCGRKGHRVECEAGLMLTVCCEAIINEHKKVFRSALVGLGERPKQTPVMIVEPYEMPATDAAKNELVNELEKLAAGNDLTKPVRKIMLHESLPVDIRHNAKINRELLTEWAAGKLSASL
ncbi:MAG: AMP-binding protein [Planctomycetes bacterium]|nr:AMP-binding protein [Planctomycetota bacterium]